MKECTSCLFECCSQCNISYCQFTWNRVRWKGIQKEAQLTLNVSQLFQWKPPTLRQRPGLDFGSGNFHQKKYHFPLISERSIELCACSALAWWKWLHMRVIQIFCYSCHVSYCNSLQLMYSMYVFNKWLKIKPLTLKWWQDYITVTFAWWGHKSGFNLKSELVRKAFTSHLCIEDLLLKLCLTCFIKAALRPFSEPKGSKSNLFLWT